MPTYDYPCNERVRLMLRLEDMFAKLRFFAEGSHEYHHHTALLLMFQMLELLDRSELKTDLLQELDRQKILLDGLRGNPAIEQDTLLALLAKLEQAAGDLRAMTNRIGQALRDNEWLMGVRQRSVIPGGACQFDVPSYHYWLGLTPESRQLDLRHWLTPLQALKDALSILLQILRGSGKAISNTALLGSFQQMLGSTKPVQMLRVTLPPEATCFPEVSANKYAIGIRFCCLDGAQKPRLCDVDVEFQLSLCNM